MFKFGVEVQNNVLERNDSQKIDKVSTDFKCDLCDYKAKKLTTLRKHINSKHTEQKYKVCGRDFKISMQLVSHVANEHMKRKNGMLKFTVHQNEKEMNLHIRKYTGGKDL